MAITAITAVTAITAITAIIAMIAMIDIRAIIASTRIRADIFNKNDTVS